MKTSVLLLALLFFSSCSTKNKLDEANLPKDIALKKTFDVHYKTDSVDLAELRSEINAGIINIKCEDASKWKIAAMGSKACGGPASFIAYPKEMELDIKPKLERYAIMESGFNEKYGITSDCAVEKEPAGIACENGIAVLVK